MVMGMGMWRRGRGREARREKHVREIRNIGQKWGSATVRERRLWMKVKEVCMHNLCW